jgi:hypothetical protein
VSTDVLLCATDAGGARNVAPLIPVLLARGARVTGLFSAEVLALADPDARLVDRHTLTSTQGPDALTLAQVSDALAIAQDRRPAAIVCGTTRHASLDRTLTAWGSDRNIRTVVVLDEWYRYRARFEDAAGRPCWPSLIAVMDAQALEEAAREGVPRARCRVTGSPSLSALSDLAAAYRHAPPPQPELLHGLPRPVVTFVSEPHHADYGDAPGRRGREGEFLGYTERSVREELLALLEAMDAPSTLVERPHPSAPEPPVAPTSRRVAWGNAAGVPLWPLLWHSDLVIGMRSMALTEAAILDARAASYQPNGAGEERCTAVRLGLAPGFVDPEPLRVWLRQYWSTVRVDRPSQRFAFAPADAAERVVELAMSAAVCA